MAKRRKIKWGRVIGFFAIIALVIFLLVQGITLLFSDKEQSSTGGNKKYISTVVIDPGHGGWDNGCSKDELYEKDITLKVSNEIAKVLEKNKIKAVLTRSNDSALAEEKNKDLAARVNASKDNYASYFVSIHVNSYEGNEDISGYEIYTKDTDSEAIANSIITSLKTAGYENSRGLYNGNLLYVLRRNTVKSIMVEMGYINSSDIDYLGNDEKLKEFSKAIADGIVTQIKTELGLNEVNTK